MDFGDFVESRSAFPNSRKNKFQKGNRSRIARSMGVSMLRVRGRPPRARRLIHAGVCVHAGGQASKPACIHAYIPTTYMRTYVQIDTQAEIHTYRPTDAHTYR